MTPASNTPITPFDKSGWALAHVIVTYRDQVRPLLGKAEKTTDGLTRAALMREAADKLEGKIRSLRAGADLAEEQP